MPKRIVTRSRNGGSAVGRSVAAKYSPTWNTSSHLARTEGVAFEQWRVAASVLIGADGSDRTASVAHVEEFHPDAGARPALRGVQNVRGERAHHPFRSVASIWPLGSSVGRNTAPRASSPNRERSIGR